MLTTYPSPFSVFRRFVSSSLGLRSAVAVMTTQTSPGKRPHPDIEAANANKRRRSSPPPNLHNSPSRDVTAMAATNGIAESAPEKRITRILPIGSSRNLGRIIRNSKSSLLEDWHLEPIPPEAWSKEREHLEEAARQIRESDVPVAFPSETVYGLGADATRSAAVRGIYAAKRRPADNPLIVHISSYKMLRDLLRPRDAQQVSSGEQEQGPVDLIPPIYQPLIERYWPGPLTILLPLPNPSPLAPEVSGTQQTFGARFPKSPLALHLISLAGVPIAAPSANASGKPSPTSAEHVLEDMDGRIDIILDSGPSSVGVESTVVDGLSKPPAILRPGGVSLADIRKVPGWEGCVKGYKDATTDEKADEAPRAPGMKYRHYAPKAPVLLFPEGTEVEKKQWMSMSRIGVIRTKKWKVCFGAEGYQATDSGTTEGDLRSGIQASNGETKNFPNASESTTGNGVEKASFEELWQLPNLGAIPKPTIYKSSAQNPEICEVALGEDVQGIAQGLFAALRELDRLNVETILVEGIDDSEDDTAAAVMNRLRKAAEIVQA